LCYRAVLRPWLWFLTRTSNCRIFQDMSVPDIIKQVFCQFKASIDECLDKVGSTFSEQVKTLLNPKFQLFENSANLTV